MGFARQGVEPISQHPVEAFRVHTVGTGDRLPHDRAHRNTDDPPAHASLDGLRKTHILPQHQRWTPPFAGRLGARYTWQMTLR